LGGLLILAAVWLSAGELLRAKVPRFVSDREQAASVDGRGGAGYIGLLRGDIWFDDGLARWAELLAKGEAGSRDTESLTAVRAALVHAVRLAPHDARAWLLLAAVETRSASAPGGATELIITYGKAAQAQIRRPKRRELLYPDYLGHRLRLQSANIWPSYEHLTRRFQPVHGTVLPSLQPPHEFLPPFVQRLSGFHQLLL